MPDPKNKLSSTSTSCVGKGLPRMTRARSWGRGVGVNDGGRISDIRKEGVGSSERVRARDWGRVIGERIWLG